MPRNRTLHQQWESEARQTSLHSSLVRLHPLLVPGCSILTCAGPLGEEPRDRHIFKDWELSAGLCTALSQLSAREVPTGVHLGRWMFTPLAHPACTTTLAPTAFSGSSRAPIMSHVTELKPRELALQFGSESFASTGLTVHVSPLAALLLSAMHMLLDAGPACAAQQTCNQSTHPCPAPGTAVTAESARRAMGSARPCRF